LHSSLTLVPYTTLFRSLVRKRGKLVETSWDEAMERVVGRTKELLEEQGPSAVGFYTTGQLFLEEYYTLGLVAHGGIGTNHVDGRSEEHTSELQSRFDLV